MIWHSSSAEDVLKELKTDKDSGLANGTANERINKFGKNVLNDENKKFFLKEFLSQLNNKFVYILFAIAIVSFAFSVYYKNKDFISPLLIIAIVILNALISAFYLSRGKAMLEKLKKTTDPKATVIRDGIKKYIDSSELVIGDIIIFSEGDYISADARLIEAVSLRCNESAVTGESVPVEKNPQEIYPDIAPLNQRKNMVYCGSSVIHGSAKAVVVGTGINTEIGKTDTIEKQTGKNTIPLQDSLVYTGKTANIAILIICAAVFTAEFLITLKTGSGNHFAYLTVKAFLNASALAVAAIPEGLPAISTIVVALGMQRLLKDGITVKKIKALETVGNTTVICADKTGILTHNKMRVRKIFNGNELTEDITQSAGAKTSMVLKLAAVCATLVNDPTENAIENACFEMNGVKKTDIEKFYPRLCTVPFDSVRKTMTSVNMINGHPVAITKGAPEIIAEKCIGNDSEKIVKVNEAFAEESLRVVAIAIKQLDEIPANPNAEEIETDMIFVGLIGLDDPPRTDTVSSISDFSNAGIRTVMITGDNVITAKAVARRIGILKDDMIALTGKELENISDEELYEKIDRVAVFARISPDDKLRIINILKKKGECVTVTGESVSDSEALAAADTGCVMGKMGTDVAKGKADIIDEHYNLGSLKKAIKESRALFENIQKCVHYLLSCNFAELFIYFIGLLIFKIPPLAAVQLLWINLITDCTPAISLSMEPVSSQSALKKVRGKNHRLFSKEFLIQIPVDILFITAVSLISYGIGIKSGINTAAAMLFVTLSTIQIFHSYNLRSTKSVFGLSVTSNEFMLFSSLLALFIVFFLVLSPAGAVFGLSILKFNNFVYAVLLALSIIPYSEIFKLILRKNGKI